MAANETLNEKNENQEVVVRAANCTGCNYAKEFSDNGRKAYCVKDGEDKGKWVNALNGC